MSLLISEPRSKVVMFSNLILLAEMNLCNQDRYGTIMRQCYLYCFQIGRGALGSFARKWDIE